LDCFDCRLQHIQDQPLITQPVGPTQLAQAATINKDNYTNSNAIWLVANGVDNTRYQNLFAVMVPEPALIQLPALLLMSGLGLGLRFRHRKT